MLLTSELPCEQIFRLNTFVLEIKKTRRNACWGFGECTFQASSRYEEVQALVKRVHEKQKQDTGLATHLAKEYHPGLVLLYVRVHLRKLLPF